MNNTMFKLKNMNEKSMQNLSKTDIEKLNPIISSMQVRLGYDIINE